MVTVSFLVEKIIEQKPFLQEALAKGIVNNAALADQLIPELEIQLKKKIKFSAVNMAIRRLSEKLKKSFTQKTKFDKTTDILIQSDLIEIILYKTDKIQDYIKKIYSLISYKKGDFLTITQGINEVMIITNKRNLDKIKKELPNNLIKKTIKNLSSTTVHIPETSVHTIGLFYLIGRAMAWENINIIDVVSTYTEITLIINENDTARAFDTLKKLIQNNSK